MDASLIKILTFVNMLQPNVMNYTSCTIKVKKLQPVDYTHDNMN